jgi:hypothetical protein
MMYFEDIGWSEDTKENMARGCAREERLSIGSFCFCFVFVEEFLHVKRGHVKL